MVSPVTDARALVLEIGIEVGWQPDRSVAAQEQIVDAGTVDVDLSLLVAAVAQPTLTADPELMAEELSVVVVVGCDAPAPVHGRVAGVVWQVGESPVHLIVHVV